MTPIQCRVATVLQVSSESRVDIKLGRNGAVTSPGNTLNLGHRYPTGTGIFFRRLSQAEIRLENACCRVLTTQDIHKLRSLPEYLWFLSAMWLASDLILRVSMENVIREPWVSGYGSDCALWHRIRGWYRTHVFIRQLKLRVYCHSACLFQCLLGTIPTMLSNEAQSTSTHPFLQSPDLSIPFITV